MFNSHIFSRFLRLVRSIRRSLFAFFVAIAMLLATFVIAPTYALSAGGNAGESATSTEKVEGAKAGSTKSDVEQQQPDQSESNNNTEPNKKNTGSSDTLKNNNKESKSVEKQNSDSNKVDDKAKSTDSDVKKNAKDAQKKDVDSAKAVNGTDRSAKKEPQLPESCRNAGIDKLAKCYSITYGDKTINIKSKNGEPYNRVPQIITPTIKFAGKVQQTLPKDVWLGLEKYMKDDSVKYAFFKGENDKNDSYTAKSTQGVSNSDGSIRFFASKWMAANTYRFNVVIHYPGGSKSSTRIKAILDKKDLPKVQPDDLSLSLYDFGKADDKVSVSNDKITIKPKSKGSAPSGGTDGSATGGTDKKDVYDPIDNKLFIESQSKDKPGFIYHRMICHETGRDDNASYTVGSVNGLSLGTQTQFEHMENQNRPDKNAENSAVYEDDKYTEESQRWISGTPTKSGTFECKVFAVKKDDGFRLERKAGGGKTDVYSTVLDEFDTRVETNKQSLFDKPEQNIVEDKWTNKASIKQGIDWDYKTITIQFGDKPEPPKIGENDLTLKVYPFNGSKTALTSDNNKISAMLGMELKPFVDATSAADSANKITLRVLCKGEKNNAAGSGGTSTGGTGSTESGSAVSGSSEGTAVGGSTSSTQSGSQPTQPFEPSQSAEATWSSKPDGLVLSVPEDDNQNTCHSNKEGDKTCESVDPNKKVAARTDKEVSIKPTDVGNYQCVVYALKPDALKTFDDAIKNTKSDSLTPDSIKSALTSAKPTAFKENKDFAAFTFNIDSVSNFTLPQTGGQSWNLQLGILAALLVNLLAAGFVVSQSERGRKLILGRWRGLCNYV
ncbi:hypothetical protein [Gardnerella swidsinskii]|uniref:hypothetical protein n=1 Tax=Gardnerella swidsinskii TaxID=2792979 RepID=UPI0036F48402